MPEPIDYHEPRRIWVDDGHVCIEGYDGVVLRMTPEVAILLGRRLSEAGSESLINRVMDNSNTSATVRGMPDDSGDPR